MAIYALICFRCGASFEHCFGAEITALEHAEPIPKCQYGQEHIFINGPALTGKWKPEGRRADWPPTDDEMAVALRHLNHSA